MEQKLNEFATFQSDIAKIAQMIEGLNTLVEINKEMVDVLRRQNEVFEDDHKEFQKRFQQSE